MAGFFAAAAKTPFSTLVIVSEMTGGYRLLLPSLWVCGLSYILSDEQSIYSSQVDGRSRSPAHQGSYVRQVLAGRSGERLFSSGQSTPLLHPNDPLVHCFRPSEHYVRSRFFQWSAAMTDYWVSSTWKKRILPRSYLSDATGACRRPHENWDSTTHPKRHPGPGLGTFRGKRSTDLASRERSQRTSGHRNGAAF